MKRENCNIVIQTVLGLDSEKYTLVPLTERVVRIYFDDEVREADIQRIKYRVKNYCDVTQYNPYTIDLLRKNSSVSLAFV